MSDDAEDLNPTQTTAASGSPDRDAEGADDDGEILATMWTAPALEAYQAKVGHLIDVLTTHAQLVSTRAGRQRELPAYFASADSLQRAVNNFADAEFDWCGSIPVRGSDVDDEDVEDAFEDVEGDVSLEGLGVLTVLGRYDYVITDAAALVEEGRRGYLRHWTHETPEDAQQRVQEPSDAVRELLHGAPLAELEGVPGLQLTTWVSQLIQHGGSDDDEVAENPFGIAGQS